MDGMAFQVVEQVYEELFQQELVELSTRDLDQVGAGLYDPGIIEIDK